MGKFRNVFKWAEVKERTDIYTWKGTTRWGNHDLYPIVASEKQFGYLAYAAYWVTGGTALFTFTLGSGYIAVGLNVGQTVGACLVGALLSSVIGVFGARPGQDYGIGYTVLNRMSFGMYGTYVPIFVVFIAGFVFSGIQAFFGGQAMNLMLGAIFPSFRFMKNTLPASAAITTQDLIGFLLYIAVYVPILYVIKPHQLRLGLYPTFICTCTAFTGILIWALVSAGGTGDLISSTIDLTASQQAFRFIQCVSSISGTWGGSADRYSDWSRFEKKRGVSIPGLFCLPVVVCLSALFGALTTTATTKMYGFTEWNPILLLQHVQTVSYTPACRAGTFFVGFALFWAQVFLNMSQNSFPYGMDVAAAFPRYFSTKRAAFMLLIGVVIVQPWRFLSQASIFITILSCVSIYFAAGTAIVLSDYWIIRKKMLKVPDLYVGKEGIYWYTRGVNYRCIGALLVGAAPCLPGFFYTLIEPTADNAWVKMFQICWFISAPLAFITYLGVNHFWPVEGLGIQEFIPTAEESIEVIEGQSSASSTHKKGPVEISKKLDV